MAISSNSTTVQPDIPTAVVEACLAHDEEAACALAEEAGSLRTYPATKLAVAYWVRRQATGADWAGAGVRLNAVAPGMIETPMITDMRSDPDVGPLLAMFPIPVGRTGRPEEIAALIDFLLGPEGGYFCGSVGVLRRGHRCRCCARTDRARALEHFPGRLRQRPLRVVIAAGAPAAGALRHRPLVRFADSRSPNWRQPLFKRVHPCDTRSLPFRRVPFRLPR